MTTTATKASKENENFRLIPNENKPEIYTDGISAMMLGENLSKLNFFSTLEVCDQIEQRKEVLLLTIPTPALLEMCRDILEFAHSSNNVEIMETMKGVDIKDS